MHEGPLKKAGTGFMSAIFQSRWCVLFSDGILVVFDGQTRAHQKTSLTLAKDPSTVVLSGTDTLLVRVPPADGKKGTAVEHRFRAASAEQAEEWLQKMHSARRGTILSNCKSKKRRQKTGGRGPGLDLILPRYTCGPTGTGS